MSCIILYLNAILISACVDHFYFHLFICIFAMPVLSTIVIFVMKFSYDLINFHLGDNDDDNDGADDNDCDHFTDCITNLYCICIEMLIKTN